MSKVTCLQDAKQSSLFRLSTADAPKHTQCVLAVLYSLSWRLERIIRFSTDTSVRDKQLAWWFDEITKASSGQSNLPAFIELEAHNQSSDTSRIWPLLHQFVTHLMQTSQYVSLKNEVDWHDFSLQRRGIWLDLCAQLQNFVWPKSVKDYLAHVLTIYDMALGHGYDAQQGFCYWPKTLLDKYQTPHHYNRETHNQWRPVFEYFLKEAERQLQLALSEVNTYHPAAESIFTFATLLKTKVRATTLWCQPPGTRVSATLPLKYLWVAWNTKRKFRSLTRGKLHVGTNRT